MILQKSVLFQKALLMCKIASWVLKKGRIYGILEQENREFTISKKYTF